MSQSFYQLQNTSGDLLQGVTIVDLSHRLPGPYAGMILANLGAKVIKIEDKKFQDPFNSESGPFAQDKSFKDWYQQLNRSKEIHRIDFNCDEDILELKRTVRGSDAVIMGLPWKVQQKLGITPEELKHMAPLVYIDAQAARHEDQSYGMHDLNALAQTGLLKLHLQSQAQENKVTPPFLPFAGLGLGHTMATTLLAAMVRSRKNNEFIQLTCFLKESAEMLYSPFYSQELQEQPQKDFLHTGRYPCYGIYFSQDGKAFALAAVEEKFWIKFCEIFKLEQYAQEKAELRLSPVDRPEGKKLREHIEKIFSAHTSDQILTLNQGQNMCLDPI